MESLRETISSPPYILGNFPRIEIIFDCIEISHFGGSEDPHYTKLVNLKRLLDSGTITQEEFDREKTQDF